MNIQYRHQQYTVDPCTLIVRESGFYARIQVAGRVPMVAYVKVTPPQAAPMVYTCELPPRAIVVWKPVITLTPHPAAQVNHAIGVQVQVAA